MVTACTTINIQYALALFSLLCYFIGFVFAVFLLSAFFFFFFFFWLIVSIVSIVVNTQYKNIRTRKKLSSNRFKCIINFVGHSRIILYRYFVLIHQKVRLIDTIKRAHGSWTIDFFIFIIFAKAFCSMSKTFSVVVCSFQTFSSTKMCSFSFSKSIILQLPTTVQNEHLCDGTMKINDGHTQKRDRQQNGKSDFKMKLLYKVVFEITQLTEM